MHSNQSWALKRAWSCASQESCATKGIIPSQIHQEPRCSRRTEWGSSLVSISKWLNTQDETSGDDSSNHDAGTENVNKTTTSTRNKEGCFKSLNSKSDGLSD